MGFIWNRAIRENTWLKPQSQIDGKTADKMHYNRLGYNYKL